MPSRFEHLQFDMILEERGIINSAEEGDRVHQLMDRGIEKFGHWQHREVDPKHSPEGVRERLHVLASLYDYDQDMLTDCVRICYGHIALDEAYGDTRRALIMMRARGWDRKYYRHVW